jgi:hypothetical protein
MRNLFPRASADQCQSWKQGKLDMAEHLFHEFDRIQHVKAETTVMKAADLFYEIGKEQLDQSESYIATKWLYRARDLLATRSDDFTAFDAGDLKLNVLHTLGTSEKAQLAPI